MTKTTEIETKTDKAKTKMRQITDRYIELQTRLYIIKERATLMLILSPLAFLACFIGIQRSSVYFFAIANITLGVPMLTIVYKTISYYSFKRRSLKKIYESFKEDITNG